MLLDTLEDTMPTLFEAVKLSPCYSSVVCNEKLSAVIAGNLSTFCFLWDTVTNSKWQDLQTGEHCRCCLFQPVITAQLVALTLLRLVCCMQVRIHESSNGSIQEVQRKESLNTDKTIEHVHKSWGTIHSCNKCIRSCSMPSVTGNLSFAIKQHASLMPHILLQ